MPKSRIPSAKITQHCSFCGHHKNDVPLIITSNIKPQAACCCTCALAIVEQTWLWADGIFKETLKIQKRIPAIITPFTQKDAVDAVLKKASNDGRNGKKE